MTELELTLRARYPLVALETPEEARALAALHQLATALGKTLVPWSFASGLGGDPSLKDPLTALETIRRSPERAIYALCDLSAFFGNPGVVRALREAAAESTRTAKSLVLVSPSLRLPPELLSETTIVEFPAPDAQAIAALVDQAARMAPGGAAIDGLAKERLVTAGLGLTAPELANALSKALVLHRQLDFRAADVVAAEKRQIVKKQGLLEFVPPEAELAGVGGLGALKDWLGKRRLAFEPAAREFGLPEPRGLLLVGAPGCGKSLMAKAVASAWQLPLLRLDLGKVLAGVVGQSEANLRAALSLAESISPCVLWVDELEKGISGAGKGGASDGGVSGRLLGSFLTWLEEKRKPVFLVATANDPRALPPELVRKGRFDETFFVDLPDAEARAAIWRIHLERRRRLPEQFDLEALAALSAGYSGAEIEQALIDGLYAAFDAGRALEQTDLEAAIAQTVPWSRGADAALEALRAWARLAARPADDSRPAAGGELVAFPSRRE